MENLLRYRAWDKIRKKMGVVISNNWMTGVANIIIDNKETLRQKQDYILMQSTGLKDKNDVEIFEGDVVQFEDCYIESDFLYINKGIVEWSQGRFTVTNRDSVEMEDLLDGELLDVTIIGNIYENQELVEGNA